MCHCASQVDSFGRPIQPQAHHVDVRVWKIFLFTPGSCQVKCFMTVLFIQRLCTAAGVLCPKSRITSSQPCFFRVSFWVTWSPSVSILIFSDIFLCHKSEMSDGQFWFIHFHGQSIHMCKDSFSGEQRCCFNAMPNTFCFVVWRALIFRVLAENHDQQRTVILGVPKMHTPQTVR